MPQEVIGANPCSGQSRREAEIHGRQEAEKAAFSLCTAGNRPASCPPGSGYGRVYALIELAQWQGCVCRDGPVWQFGGRGVAAKLLAGFGDAGLLPPDILESKGPISISESPTGEAPSPA